MKTKFFYSTMKGAPVLDSIWGSLLDTLKACLLTGFNSQQVSSLTATDGIATITLASNHGFLQHQVVLISGADQAELNGEFVLESVDATTAKFKTTFTGTATGSLMIKTAPLGWTEKFTGNKKSVFQPKDTTKNRFVLRVDNSCPVGYDTTWAKFARVTIAEQMNGIDDFATFLKAPQSTINEQGNGTTGTAGIYGVAKWYHGVKTDSLYEASTAGQGVKDWVLIGDDSGFYFMPQITNQTGRAMYCFTSLDKFNSTDAWAGLLCATDGYRAANANGDASAAGRNSANNQWHSLNQNGKYLLRKYDGTGTDYEPCGFFSLNVGNNQQVSGRSSDIAMPSMGNQVVLHDVYVKATQGLRGTLPIVKWIHQQWYLQDKIILDKTNGRYLIIGNDFANEGMTSFFAFELEF